MAVEKQLITFEDFLVFALQPGNENREFELINGEIIEKMPGRTSNSEIRDIIVGEVRPFCKQHGIPCHTSGEAGAYEIQGSVVVPDFAYKTTPMSNEYPDPVPPLWVVEVISPTDRAKEIRDKRQVYLQAKLLYWEIYPESRSVDVYMTGQMVKTFHINDMLDGGNVLPGFSLAVRELFSGV